MEPFDVLLDRMARDRQWGDASVIHALACVFHVDVAIWQAHSDPMLVGLTLNVDHYHNQASELVPIALHRVSFL